MDVPPETFPSSSASIRRDTMSTISSDKQPSPPSGSWPVTIHGNCARCGHYHKAAVVQIHLVEGMCEASDVVCDRCGQKWLTVGGLNSTQISLLSTVTTELDYGEINFRYTLLSMVRSTVSIASPTALANVPEDPSPTPSRKSSARCDRKLPDDSANAERGINRNYRTNASPVFNVEARPTLKNEPMARSSLPSLSKNGTPALKVIRRKLKNAFESEGSVPNTEMEIQRQSTSLEVVASASLGNERPSRPAKYDDGGPAKTTRQIIEDLKSVDKEAIRNMTPKQRDMWIRERITAFKQSKRRSALQCDCKRRHSTSSIGDYYSLPPHRSATTSTFQRYSLEQMGSQFDALPAGALFTHTGPLTISATRISEADTAVELPEGSSSPRSSLHAHSRSPRPASLFRSRLSWQQPRYARTQRDSMDSVLAGTARSSWRGVDRLSLASVAPQDISTGSDAPETSRSADPVMEEEVSTTSRRSGVPVPALLLRTTWLQWALTVTCTNYSISFKSSG
ncbi:hypothetical protein P171DRAFT_47272 [Karstenula rhodostoma CBS 690.94]|uniref:Uncharacterized protein n=1 Tax=Karstenula rhodostoma CBS 690.94 TaxID=1392251 RepID=A0A9P4PCT6_9PLEO|nr:hypothetical protein P171DRAFT_47272 [Karstenula rhodostoma CBS 690.94]